MKNDRIIDSWNKIEPSDSANNRMLAAIIEQNHSAHERKEMVINMRNEIKSKKMKAAIAACLAAIVVVTGFWGSHLGWFKTTKVSDDIVLPPARIGAATEHASFAARYTFETAYSEADAVARVIVGSWLGEDIELDKTYYEASVQQCFKGELPKKITLLQEGCSLGTLKGYPLFTSGNELLVFINRANIINLDAGMTNYDEGIAYYNASITKYASPYWIIGSFTTLLDVSYDKAGTRYYVDRYGMLGETIGISTNYANQESVYEEVYERAADNDVLVKEMRYVYPYIFSEDDMINLLEGYKK